MHVNVYYIQIKQVYIDKSEWYLDGTQFLKYNYYNFYENVKILTLLLTENTWRLPGKCFTWLSGIFNANSHLPCKLWMKTLWRGQLYDFGDNFPMYTFVY